MFPYSDQKLQMMPFAPTPSSKVVIMDCLQSTTTALDNHHHHPCNYSKDGSAMSLDPVYHEPTLMDSNFISMDITYSDLTSPESSSVSISSPYSTPSASDIATPPMESLCYEALTPSVLDIPVSRSSDKSFTGPIDPTTIEAMMMSMGPGGLGCDHDEINFCFQSYSDLNVLENIVQEEEDTTDGEKEHRQLVASSNRPSEEELDRIVSAHITVPEEVRLHSLRFDFLETVMMIAESKWCCMGFKIAPITVDLLRSWQKAPPAIVYCIASICLVTIPVGHVSQGYCKQAAMVFYENARKKMDDIFNDDLDPLTIQSYFVLSYTSNLLRLYEHQTTWGRMAAIALLQRVQDILKGRRPLDELTVLCWCRWYYIDSWMSLTRGRDCLLPDELPLIKFLPEVSVTPESSCEHDDQVHFDFRQNLYQFARMTSYMRKYMHAERSNRLYYSVPGSDCRYPSLTYARITEELKTWYNEQISVPSDVCSGKRAVTQMSVGSPSFCAGTDVNLHLCYNSMRIVILAEFLQPDQPPPNEILVDCLCTNFALLQALGHLKEVGCDQSTYHHMFFAIHNTAHKIYIYGLDDTRAQQFQESARRQLQMNLELLCGTQAYENDVFKVRCYAERITQELQRLNIPVIRSQSVGEMSVFKGITASLSTQTTATFQTMTFRQNPHPMPTPPPAPSRTESFTPNKNTTISTASRTASIASSPTQDTTTTPVTTTTAANTNTLKMRPVISKRKLGTNQSVFSIQPVSQSGTNKHKRNINGPSEQLCFKEYSPDKKRRRKPNNKP
ncbi:hypothetical protein EC973_004228 [Apophysomyces ossiformis]|uniref:Transcription factor domain-containing protein n=1 Tax=Apophysomyces ossiformis TaxID=679940 RepID=A0A8H7BQ61_9FUNG|nr:hypothetical protein EC973_004228 [Apophysomyces ossiformis]